MSVVGTERLTDIGYFLGKVAQEELIDGLGIPYSIVRATQFFEFFESIAQVGTVGDEVRLGPVFIQPMAADDVADVRHRRGDRGASGRCRVEVAGPDRVRLDEFVGGFLHASDDSRTVVADSPPATSARRSRRTPWCPAAMHVPRPTAFEQWSGGALAG